MRHSRKAVMAERYKLYMKKHVFNGKYFVRNVQIGLGLVLVVALIVGMSMMFLSVREDAVTAKADVSIKAALLGLDVTEENATRATKKAKEVAVTEEITTEVAETDVVQITQEVENVAVVEEATTEATTEEPSLFDDRCIAKVEESLNVRMEPDSDSEFVGQMPNGAIAKILGTSGEWTKIKSGDVTGYVLSEFILTGKDAESFSSQYVTLTGTVLEDGVNIRADRSVDAEILHVFDKGDTVSVVEVPEKEENSEVTESEETEVEDVVEDDVAPQIAGDDSIDNSVMAYAAAAGVKVDENAEADAKAEEEEATVDNPSIDWITVCLEDGQIGYVSSEFIQIDELYELAVSAEELQRIAEEKARMEAEEAARIAMAESSNSSSSSSSNYAYDSDSSSSSSSSDNYVGDTTTPVTADSSGDCLGTFTITAYCGCSQCSGGSGLTATGTVPAEGRTIAADTSVLPYGTQVVIDGVVYTVEDCGSGVCGNHIDIFFSTHERALAFGRRTMKVYRY